MNRKTIKRHQRRSKGQKDDQTTKAYRRAERRSTKKIERNRKKGEKCGQGMRKGDEWGKKSEGVMDFRLNKDPPASAGEGGRQLG